MKKYLIIDPRMRDLEKEYLRNLGYELVEIYASSNAYQEISGHVDIFCAKIADTLVLESNLYNIYSQKRLYNNVIKDFFESVKITRGKSIVFDKYPHSVPYNMCIMGNFAIHNFKHTDYILKSKIRDLGLKLIDVEQGYTKCNIAVINERSCITSDKGIADALDRYDIDVLYIDSDDVDIKLLNKNSYSDMSGFIGGATAKIGNKFIVFGDMKNIKKETRNRIYDFVNSRNIELIDFKGLDIIDYGGIVEI